MPIDRRDFLRTSAAAAAGFAVLPTSSVANDRDLRTGSFAPGIIDTNVNVLGWPFRNLKYADASELVDKLKQHRVEEAWTGNYEALLHKNIDGVNRRLVETCSTHGKGMLIPFGTVNPSFPDWEEDLRRCDETYGMVGIRLYPSYQNYALDLPDFARLLQLASERDMLVQIAVDMEDERVHHPRVISPAVDVSPLPSILAKIPHARVQLVNAFRHVRGNRLDGLINETNVIFDIANLEGNGGVGRLLAGNHWFLSGKLPLDRLVFGSHAPYFPMENAVLKLFESPLTQVQLAAVMNENAKRIKRI